MLKEKNVYMRDRNKIQENGRTDPTQNITKTKIEKVWVS